MRKFNYIVGTVQKVFISNPNFNKKERNSAQTSLELCWALTGTLGTLSDGMLSIEVLTAHQILKECFQGTPKVLHLL